MPELDKQDIRSSELQEVMSEIPGSILRWGLFVFFLILALLLAGSYLIKSPGIVSVQVVLTTQNPPVDLVSRSSGEIEKLYVSEGSFIAKDEVVAIIGNACDYDDLTELKAFLVVFNENTDWISTVSGQKPPPDRLLGEIQSTYVQFQKEWKEMKDYIDQAYIPNKLNLLEQQMHNKRDYAYELEKQKALLSEDLDLAKKSFERDSILFYKNNGSVSATEYEKSRQVYIQKRYSYSVFLVSLKSNETDLLISQEDGLDLQMQYEKELKQYIFSMEESLQLLRSSISQWEDNYMITSPVDGIVTFTGFWNENQNIKTGETLANVIPNEPTDILVRATIPVSEFGQIEVGQDVDIKLAGFPYTQYGVLKGKIFSLSQVPDERGYIADIRLLNGMTSSYSEKIRFIHQMEGTADIITEDNRLIFKLIDPLKSLMNN